jgi:ATP-dependent helicase/nuclease subunit A
VQSVSDARASARSEAENEYRRLLYVAMTRAADRLIICGAEGGKAAPKGCWYDLVRGPLSSLLVEEKENGEAVFRYRKVPSALERSAATDDQKAIRPMLPAWLRQPAAAEVPRAVTLSPSSAFDEESGGTFAHGASAADRKKALQRGRLVHRLMQALPDIAAERRKDAATRYLGKAAADFSAVEQAEIVQKILAILDDKSFAEFFAPGSRAELPIVGRFARADAPPIHVSGQVDRLAVTGDAVLIADYKTDRVVPQSLGAVQPYVTQLALYRAVLARLYPGKAVRTALLFTEGPQLMEVPATAMDAAFAAQMAKAHAPVKVP